MIATAFQPLLNTTDLTRSAVRTLDRLVGEAIPATTWQGVSQYARTLPRYIDDITRDFGVHQYRIMRQDPQIESALAVLIWGLLANDYTLTSALEQDDPGFTDSEEIARFCRENLHQLETPFLQTLAEVALGIAYGYKVAEVEYAVEDWGTDWGRRTVLKTIKCKPADTFAFVVDRFNNILGLIPVTPGGAFPALADLVPPGLTESPDSAKIAIIARRKFLIFSYRPENGDPRGISILRAAYHPWWFKTQVYLGWLQFLARFASPSVVVTTDPEGELTPPDDETPGSTPSADEMDPVRVARDTAEQIKAGAGMGLPGGWKAELLETSNTGQPFIEAIHAANAELTKTILGQTLMTNEAAHMARAASETHQDVFGIILRHIKICLAGAVLRDVLIPLIEENYGADAARRYRPRFALGETEHQDFAGIAAAIAALWKVGFYEEESQAPLLDNLMSGPSRDKIKWAAKVKAQREILDSAKAQIGADVGKLDARLVAKGQAERTSNLQEVG